MTLDKFPELFHAIDPNDGMFCHNIALSKGQLIAVSLARQAHPEWEGILSPYEAFTREREKETIFERVRASIYPNCPPRLGSIFLFPTREAADKANSDWWSNQRQILLAKIVQAPRVGTFDAKLLDATSDEWEKSAHRYWSGEMTYNPSPEVLIDGIVQLYGWESYGRIFGFLKKNQNAD